MTNHSFMLDLLTGVLVGIDGAAAAAGVGVAKSFAFLEPRPPGVAWLFL